MFEELRTLVRKDYELHHLALQSHSNFKEDPRSKLPCYRVPQTGATCDTRSAIQVLMRYCSHLPKVSNRISRPLFWHTRHGEDMFECALLLPESVPPHLRCYLSSKTQSKRTAKSLVALQCIQKLHQHHELNDYLRSNPRFNEPPSHPFERSTIAAEDEGPTVSVSIKHTPEALMDTSGDVNAGLSLHLYAFELEARPVLLRSEVLLNSLLDSLSLAGLALPAKLPEDDLSFKFVLKKIPIRIRPRYVGFVHFSSEDMFHIQRYHRAILCWETADDMDKALPVRTWTQSSGGLYYLLVPLQKEGDILQAEEPRGWLRHAADEAQLLVNNLIKHALRTPSDDNRLGTYYSKDLASEGVIVSHHYGLFSVPVPEKPKKLTDVMMEIRGKRIEYHEYYLKKQKLTEERINELHRDSRFELMPARGVPIKCSAVNLLASPDFENEVSSLPREEDDNVKYLIPEACYEIGLLRHYSTGILFPCIIWRVQSVFITQDCLSDLRLLFNQNNQSSRVMGTRPEEGPQLPPLTLLLEAMTPRLAHESIDCERLEMLGDSVMKLLVSLRLYPVYPEADEGELTMRRAALGA